MEFRTLSDLPGRFPDGVSFTMLLPINQKNLIHVRGTNVEVHFRMAV